MFLLVGSLWLAKNLVDISGLLPPLYSQYHWQEMALPQHSEDLPYPDDNSRKFLWMSDHVRGYGKWFRRCNYWSHFTAHEQAQVGGMSSRSISWTDTLPTSQNDRKLVPLPLRDQSVDYCMPTGSCSIITLGTLDRCRIHTGRPTSYHHVFQCLP